MQRKHLIIVVVAVILLAAVAGLLAWNMQTVVNKTANVTQTIQNNVSNGTSIANNTPGGNDTGWVWSEQQMDYIKQFTDLDGNEHTIFRSTGNELVFMKDGSVFLNGINITDEWNQDFS